ncbi:unnamed protein product [Rhizoctonia solani]|uniref:Malate dehydrogenase n=1 Tax=Rhizoctonia solani TaxID=456999 RepID=A0A8H3HHG1_9AGAM|nr:unnamed protein product [Rhizoctonia solani]CAE6531960.1 unnamed protein product [Rhizoctonia solani]
MDRDESIYFHDHPSSFYKMHFFVFAAIASALILVLAAPTPYVCDVSHARLALPATQTISAPNDARPEYIALAIGTQNYTCTNMGTYRSDGAVSTLYDISCLYKSDPELFDDVQNAAYNILLKSEDNTPSLNAVEDVIGIHPYTLGEHYFIPQNGAIVPMFDFSHSQKGDNDSFMVGRQIAGIPSPKGPQNIDWLQLERTSGQLARYVFRVDTRGGQPPDTCNSLNEGQDITVPYTAKYWFYD